MIHRIFSSLKSFKELELRPGLNILLSDKTPGASNQQTRNRTGKSTLIELIHFVCGANCDPDSPFRSPELLQSAFGLELDIYGKAAMVSRSASEPSKVVVESSEALLWPKQPNREKDSPRNVITNINWREVLGSAFFTIDGLADGGEGAARPTFRSLFSYFARRENGGGMREATRNSTLQQTVDEQMAISYLIGFDWTIAQQWETVRQKERQIRELKRIVGQGGLSGILDSAASLRSRLVVAQEKLKRITTTLSSFRVLEQYHELESEASKITRELSELADESELDRTYIGELETAMKVENPPTPANLTHLYEEAGIVLGEAVLRRYEDVLKFHESVVRNRRSYLQGEYNSALERMSSRDAKRKVLDQRRSELMGMLKSHGALDQFVSLQAEHGRLQAEVETLKYRFEAAEKLESANSSFELDRGRLEERLRQEFGERSAVLDDAIRTFSRIVEDLYGEPGQLEFHTTRNGPQIRIAIQGDRSRGIGNMEIFCFDMVLQHMCARQKIGPGFLVHDSQLFDGVDPRQTGRALAVGARLTQELGFQYIVTLNSDVLSELPSDFKVEPFVLPQRMTDATESGGLFGIRFEPPRNGERESRARREASRSDGTSI